MILVVQERPDELLLHHFFLVTSIGREEMDAEAVLDRYRQRGTAESHMGELMDVLAPALSSTTRTKRRYAGRPLTPIPEYTDPFARNEAKLLLALLAYEIVHVARTALEAVTGSGWSLKRTRRTVLTAAGRLLLGGRRLTLAIEARHADLWTRLWRHIQTWAWAPAAPWTRRPPESAAPRKPGRQASPLHGPRDSHGAQNYPTQTRGPPPRRAEAVMSPRSASQTQNETDGEGRNATAVN
ncbi:hypothetical protein [Yunchengibacter salinarum]|uniref:hypothetical protein n=1 Tax=Yunchengibacter salinarum TaxID=3133399 RepID=UPI0035B5FA2A